MVQISKFDKFIVANWKLNGSKAFAHEYLSKLNLKTKLNNSSCIVICPPFTYINQIQLKGLFIGAQDCSIYSNGAYTGEVSAKMLKDIGCKFCIVGHSERRNLFFENDIIIRKKIYECHLEDIIPILCIGENLQQKKDNLTKDILREQIKNCLPKESNNNNIILAYEPLWAIGTGVTPKFDEISEIQLFIKNNIFQNKGFKILYGGSVNALNFKHILNLEGVDGLLIGGASININEFKKIIQS